MEIVHLRASSFGEVGRASREARHTSWDPSRGTGPLETGASARDRENSKDATRWCECRTAGGWGGRSCGADERSRDEGTSGSSNEVKGGVVERIVCKTFPKEPLQQDVVDATAVFVSTVDRDVVFSLFSLQLRWRLWICWYHQLWCVGVCRCRSSR